jgi:two-component system osmolarity sensor histidine kinase EnvZ
LRTTLEELRDGARREGAPVTVAADGDLNVMVRPLAIKRCIGNLIANAQRYGNKVAVNSLREGRFVTIHIDDDGPGIAPEHREEVFRPFLRLDEARNQDQGGSGLGLAIARDIARAHGGEITLAASALGGLRATIRIPV